MAQRYLGSSPRNADAAMEALFSESAAALTHLAAEAFPKFVQSKACIPLVEQLLGSGAEEMHQRLLYMYDVFQSQIYPKGKKNFRLGLKQGGEKKTSF